MLGWLHLSPGDAMRGFESAFRRTSMLELARSDMMRVLRYAEMSR